MNKFNTPRDGLSENDRLGNSYGDIQRIDKASDDESQDQNETLKDNLEMFQTTDNKSRGEIDITFILYDLDKQIRIQQVLSNDCTNIDKDQLKEQVHDIRNLVPSLQTIFEQLAVFKQKDLVIPIGFTGCGKSTLMTSLVFGP